MMDEELLSLKWNNHRSTFLHILATLRDKPMHSDATLACEGSLYPVHKLVLSACSSYFESIFANISCPQPVIVLKDICSEDLEALLDYMYAGEVDVKHCSLASLIKAAECLCIKGLAVPDGDPTLTSTPNKPSGCDADTNSANVKRRKFDIGTSKDRRKSAQTAHSDDPASQLETVKPGVDGSSPSASRRSNGEVPASSREIPLSRTRRKRKISDDRGSVSQSRGESHASAGLSDSHNFEIKKEFCLDKDLSRTTIKIEREEHEEEEQDEAIEKEEEEIDDREEEFAENQAAEDLLVEKTEAVDYDETEDSSILGPRPGNQGQPHPTNQGGTRQRTQEGTCQNNEVGTRQGNEVGTRQGNEVGSRQGNEVGTRQGNEDGTCQGNQGGTRQGNAVGTCQGNEDGTCQGNEDGTCQGNEDGTRQGNEDGTCQGNQDGTRQGNAVGTCQGNQDAPSQPSEDDNPQQPRSSVAQNRSRADQKRPRLSRGSEPVSPRQEFSFTLKNELQSASSNSNHSPKNTGSRPHSDNDDYDDDVSVLRDDTCHMPDKLKALRAMGITVNKSNPGMLFISPNFSPSRATPSGFPSRSRSGQPRKESLVESGNLFPGSKTPVHFFGREDVSHSHSSRGRNLTPSLEISKLLNVDASSRLLEESLGRVLDESSGRFLKESTSRFLEDSGRLIEESSSRFVNTDTPRPPIERPKKPQTLGTPTRASKPSTLTPPTTQPRACAPPLRTPHSVTLDDLRSSLQGLDPLTLTPKDPRVQGPLALTRKDPTTEGGTLALTRSDPTAEDPLLCPFCGKLCKRRDHLRLHIRIHTGEKPFKCPYCDRRTNQKNNLKLHIRNVHPGLPVLVAGSW